MSKEQYAVLRLKSTYVYDGLMVVRREDLPVLKKEFVDITSLMIYGTFPKRFDEEPVEVTEMPEDYDPDYPLFKCSSVPWESITVREWFSQEGTIDEEVRRLREEVANLRRRLASLEK